jgi:outer membrane lipoprotein carrier protein
MIVTIRVTLLLLAVVALPAIRGAQAQSQAQAQAQTQRTPDAVARGLQTRYEGVQDFSADFVQTYRGGVLKTPSEARGTVAVKKPGKMRWLYTRPERKELVSDGREIYWYLPEDKQVMVLEPADQATTSALFLSGKGNIARDFTPSLVKAAAADTLALKLVPRKSEPEYEYLVVALDPASLQMRGLTTRDRQGGESTLVFTNMKENRRLSDKDFVFRIPRGVNVVKDGAR